MVVGSALLANMENFILDRIAFGGVKDLYELYDEDGDGEGRVMLQIITGLNL